MPGLPRSMPPSLAGGQTGISRLPGIPSATAWPPTGRVRHIPVGSQPIPRKSHGPELDACKGSQNSRLKGYDVLPTVLDAARPTRHATALRYILTEATQETQGPHSGPAPV